MIDDPKPREKFRVEGLCWCDPSLTLGHLRGMGHTKECTHARRAWEANYAHLRAVRRERNEGDRTGLGWIR